MTNSDEITLPLTEDLAEEDAPSTQPLLRELLADLRSLSQRFDAAQVANAEFQAEVRQRLDRIEVEQFEEKKQLDRMEAKLNKLHHNQLDLYADIAMVGKRVDQLEQAA